MENNKGQGVSHAIDSQVPRKIQEKAPSKLEHEQPDNVHDTGSNKKTKKLSRAVDGDSKVPGFAGDTSREGREASTKHDPQF
jgi:hypothetical protein